MVFWCRLALAAFSITAMTAPATAGVQHAGPARWDGAQHHLEMAASVAPAANGAVPDGAYKCQMWMGSSYVSLGTVRSVGGVLTPDPLAKVGATITGVTPSAGGITINYTTARGYRESMDCARE
ncbi:hypothetical protein HL658_31130 [Azospirillum sp. RWY-5-1]|uniref:Uncharacterized protein n=1 Tax=Azospirillum oleiclasticum TaxID=2735135 RepID=A0ABX2TJU3_9PROT|nr:hypothetical protein [Azospirillum oleiclasticum]NYZ17018.1 hypothetical protein [Azospirillum oleiclasticum]NYZ24538.1 hypothetical protein [Azospirillum oleiclasticum]